MWNMMISNAQNFANIAIMHHSKIEKSVDVKTVACNPWILIAIVIALIIIGGIVIMIAEKKD